MKSPLRIDPKFITMFLLLFFGAAPVWSQFSNSPKLKPSKKPSKLVLGVVADENDQPIPTAIVNLTNVQTKKISQDITDDKGEFHFGGLNPDNDYILQATFHNVVGEKEQISMYDSRNKREYYWKLPIKLSDAAREVDVILAVVDEQGRPIPGATLKFTGTKKIQTLTTTTEADGKTHMWLSTADSYSVVVSAKGFETQVRESFTPTREVSGLQIPLKTAH